MYILLYFSSNTSIAYTKSLHYLAQKEKRTLFLPIFITHSFTGVQQLLSIRVQTMKGIKGSDTRIEITFLPFLCFASIIGRCSIRNISSASLLRNAPVSPGEQRAGVHLLILTRSNCQFALLSRGAVKTIRASRRLFANKPRARAFISPPGGNPFPLFVQSSRSKAFKVISVNWREKNWPIVDDTIGLVSTVGTVYRPGSRSRNRSRNRLRGNCAVTVRR